MLGTLMTEGLLGRRRCGQLLSSQAAAEAAAEKLVAVAVHHGFDGYLINIENALSKAQVSACMRADGSIHAHSDCTCCHTSCS